MVLFLIIAVILIFKNKIANSQSTIVNSQSIMVTDVNYPLTFDLRPLIFV